MAARRSAALLVYRITAQDGLGSPGGPYGRAFLGEERRASVVDP